MDQTTTSDAARSFEPASYQRHASFVPRLGATALEWLAPRPGERILDLGAGDGVLTEALVAAGAEVVAVDASPAMVVAARARGLDAHVGDGEALGYESEFDAVFSNAALHWMLDADSVTAGVHRALRPGGRYVAEAGGFGCCAAVRAALAASLRDAGVPAPDARGPWYFPTAAHHRLVLERHGFLVDEIVVVARPTPLPSGFEGWLLTFAKAQLAPVAPEARERVIARTAERLREVLRDESGVDVADYTRLRFRARKLG